MRSLAAVAVLLVVVHVLALTGGAVWLAASGRLSTERLGEAVDLFRPTIADATRAKAKAQELEAATLRTQRDLGYLASVSDGPRPLEERLAEKLGDEQLGLHRLERIREEKDAIAQRLAQDRSYIDTQVAELETREQAVAALLDAERARRADADFQQAVKTFTAMPAKQAKAMAQALLQEGKADEVVAYLEAMPLRNRAAVLKAFKTPAEAAVAATLLERLRTAGNDRLDAAAPPLAAADPPGG